MKNPLRDFSDPTTFNMMCARNFYLEHVDVRLGIWCAFVHVFFKKDMHLRQIASLGVHSKELCRSQNAHDWERSLAAANTPVIVYAHGNAFDRAAPHRRDLYRTLIEAGYNVLAFDYRGLLFLFDVLICSFPVGFGDSTGTPTEDGVAADVQFVYMWALQFSGDNPVFIWGHSLGTGCVRLLPF